MDGEVLLEWEDETYSVGRACKWRASRKLMEMMEQGREETSSTETPLTMLEDYPRPKPSWKPQREAKALMNRLLARIGTLFESKRRMAA